MNRKVSLSFYQLRTLACGYLGLPVFIFICTYLKWYFSLIGAAAFIFVFYQVIVKRNVEQRHDHSTVFSVKTLVALFFVALVWTYLGGMNGYFYQTSDWSCRNPIYFDMINHPWPVFYENSGGALCYYIGHWIPPAAVAKLIYWITGSFRWARFLGRMLLWGWSSLGIFILFLLTFHFLKVSTVKQRIVSILILICFSGMDILGALHYEELDYLLSPEVIHLEWWSPKYQFTSIMACVYWVFNQTIIPWIITLCFLMEEDPRNYIFYGTACILCGPFPAVGLAICMVVKAVCRSAPRVLRGEIKGVLQSIFSPSNLLSLLFLLPFIATFILANNAMGAASVSDTMEAASSDKIAIAQVPFFSSAYWDKTLLLFLFLEVGCYLLLVLCDNWKKPVFYGIILVSVISPYFHVGQSNDFCMRVSVPAVFILMLYVNQFICVNLLEEKKKLPKRVLAAVLAVCMLIGAATPAVEIYRGFYHVIQEKTIFLEDSSIPTFDSADVPFNFGCSYPENTFFFKYFAGEG